MIKGFGIYFISFFWSVATALARRVFVLIGRGQVFQDLLIISVGNLQAGGAGKTPFVRYLAQWYLRQNYSVAVISRGYRRKSTDILILKPDHFKADLEVGDEARLQKEQIPEAWIGVGKKRSEVISELLNQGFPLKRSVVVLDDGFQHFSVKPNIQCLLLTERNRFDVFFRDFQSEEKWASHKILMIDSNAKSDHRYFPNTVDGVVVRSLQFNHPVDRSHEYVTVCGIADPSQFLSSLKASGIQVYQSWVFKDHHDFTSAEVMKIHTDAIQKMIKIITTGKDWVKIRPMISERRDIWIIAEPEIQWVQGESNFQAMLRSLDNRG